MYQGETITTEIRDLPVPIECIKSMSIIFHTITKNLLEKTLDDCVINGDIFICEAMEGYNVVYWKEILGNPVKVISYVEKEVAKQIPEMFIPVMSSVTLKSSTSGSSKKFKITVDDSGAISATEVS